MTDMYPITPKICMVCKAYTGKGGVCNDPKCHKILKSQLNSLFGNLHKRTILAEKLRSSINDAILKSKVNARFMKSISARHVFVECGDEKALDFIIGVIRANDKKHEICAVQDKGKIIGVGVMV